MAPVSPAPDAATLLASAQARVDAYLDLVLPPAGTGPGRLHEALRYSVFAGGKRIRPALALASARAVGGGDEAAIPFAASLELVHTYSLIHDDLPAMDDDDLRRGKPTSHVVFGEALAILAGDALHSLAFESLLARVPDARLARDLAFDLARAAGVGGMVGGQVEDLEAEGAVPEEGRLERLHRGKTAALFAAACEGGGRAGGGRPEDLAALRRFGLELGLAFQIVDDILDETGTPESLGKTPGKDREERKMTYVALEGVERARARAGARLASAVAALAGVPAPEALEALARYVVERDR
jgi:geranylgeranyl diphosphate synthase type II